MSIVHWLGMKVKITTKKNLQASLTKSHIHLLSDPKPSQSLSYMSYRALFGLESVSNEKLIMFLQSSFNHVLAMLLSQFDTWSYKHGQCGLMLYKD